MYFAGAPQGSPRDGWTRELATINGQSQLITVIPEVAVKNSGVLTLYKACG